MARLSCIILLLCSLEVSLQQSRPDDTEYVAAVVEYNVSNDVEQNRLNYIQLIEEAVRQNADIIVFPEMTLTNPTTSLPVPVYGHLQQYPIPALQPDLYDNLLVSMSSAARHNSIYVVVNVRELLDCSRNDTGELCPNSTQYVFNTNVVFDRTGRVIDRYRKINLFGEPTHTPAFQPELGQFDTDFGVTFTHFICFDLKFQVPAIQAIQRLRVTDVIFTVRWISELPYLTAVQIQEAYAYTMNVNLLAAGGNNVSRGAFGSGIYSGRAGALLSISPGGPTTRLLVSRVPKVPGERLHETYPGHLHDDPADLDGIFLLVDPSIVSHVSRQLSTGSQELVLVDGDVSCRFNVRLSLASGELYYRYRAVVFDGVRTYSGVASGGVRTCGVVACTDDTLDSCGRKFPVYAANRTAVFQELRIEATMPTPVRDTNLSADGFVVYPVSVDVSIMPLEVSQYTYSTNVTNTTTVHTYILNDFNVELYSFSLFGRDFSRDGEEPTPPIPDSANVHLLSSVLLISLLVNTFNVF